MKLERNPLGYFLFRSNFCLFIWILGRDITDKSAEFVPYMHSVYRLFSSVFIIFYYFLFLS